MFCMEYDFYMNVFKFVIEVSYLIICFVLIFFIWLFFYCDVEKVNEKFLVLFFFINRLIYLFYDVEKVNKCFVLFLLFSFICDRFFNVRFVWLCLVRV